jgi:hypothetical protein
MRRKQARAKRGQRRAHARSFQSTFREQTLNQVDDALISSVLYHVPAHLDDTTLQSSNPQTRQHQQHELVADIDLRVKCGGHIYDALIEN